MGVYSEVLEELKSLKHCPRPGSVAPLKPAPKRRHPFFDKYADYAIETMRVWGIPASVTLAQAALESAWGKSAPGNNFFGVKGEGPGGSQLLWTTEVINGKPKRVKARFRKYNNALESFEDHASVIATGRYLKHAMEHIGSARSFVEALQSKRSKYATDPRYVDKVMDIIKDYDLEVYDGR